MRARRTNDTRAVVHEEEYQPPITEDAIFAYADLHFVLDIN
jgi:hypothetical protein